jgi:hypothetical protein
MSLVADDEDAGGCFDDVVGDGFELVYFEDAGDLGEQSLKEPEVAAGYPLDCCNGLDIGEVLCVQRPSKSFPVAVQDEKEFIAAEGAVAVRESEAAVELWVVAEALVDAWHADKNDRDLGPVVFVPEKFQDGRGESFGFVDDQQFDPFVGVAHTGAGDLASEALVFVCADPEPDLQVLDVVHEVLWSGEYLGGVKDSAGAVGQCVVFGVMVTSRAPFCDVRLEGVPAGVAARGLGFAYSGVPVADPDGLLFADGVGELGEAAVLLGDDEVFVHGSSSS